MTVIAKLSWNPLKSLSTQILDIIKYINTPWSLSLDKFLRYKTILTYYEYVYAASHFAGFQQRITHQNILPINSTFYFGVKLHVKNLKLFSCRDHNIYWTF